MSVEAACENTIYMLNISMNLAGGISSIIAETASSFLQGCPVN